MPHGKAANTKVHHLNVAISTSSTLGGGEVADAPRVTGTRYLILQTIGQQRLQHLMRILNIFFEHPLATRIREFDTTNNANNDVCITGNTHKSVFQAGRAAVRKHQTALNKEETRGRGRSPCEGWGSFPRAPRLQNLKSKQTPYYKYMLGRQHTRAHESQSNQHYTLPCYADFGRTKPIKNNDTNQMLRRM